jgi:hypothetical protein
MLLSRLTILGIPTSLLLACTHAPLPAAHPAAPRAPDSDYVVIVPDVSVSATAREANEAETKQASVDPNADVMAEILAIPPGG